MTHRKPKCKIKAGIVLKGRLSRDISHHTPGDNGFQTVSPGKLLNKQKTATITTPGGKKIQNPEVLRTLCKLLVFNTKLQDVQRRRRRELILKIRSSP